MDERDFSERARRMQPSAIHEMTKLASSAGGDVILLAAGMPSPAMFPLEELAQFASDEILTHKGHNLQYGMTAGYRKLVKWIIEYVAPKRIEASAQQVLCTAGSQQAIDLITDVLIDSDDLIFVENPTYLGALAVFEKSGAQMIQVRQDPSGMVLEDLEQRLRSAPPVKRKLIYFIPNFQNPSGISLSRDRRKAIVALLEQYDAYLIEDDPYCEIYFDEDPPPLSVKHWIPDRVLYLGTFSKMLAPTFRTGWVIAEESLVRKVELAKETSDLCGSMLDQRIVYRFCSSAQFPGYLARLRSFYKERCTAMVDALQTHMPDGISWTRPEGGFFVWLTLPKDMDAGLLLEESIFKEKVTFVIGRPFTSDGSSTNCMRLAFSVENPDRIQEGIARLAALIKRRLCQK